MTTLLTREQVDSLRSIGDSALALITMWMIDQNFPGRATRPSEVALYIRKDTRTVEKQLDALCPSNRLTKTAAGYVLLDGGRALVLGMALHDYTLTPALSQKGEGEDSKDLAQRPGEIPGTEKAQAQTIVPIAPLVIAKGGTPAHNARALEEEEEESLILRDIESTSSSSNAQNALTVNGALTTAKILAATPILEGFGAGVTPNGLDVNTIAPTLALGWVAQAYDQRERPGKRGLASPAGLVYRRLKDPHEPRPQTKYHISPLKYLPENYLELLGLITYRCECGETFDKRARLEVHEKTHPIVQADELPGIDPSVYLPLSPGGKSPAQLWEDVLERLKAGLAPASFDTWVRGTKPIGFDGAELRIGVRNAYARDWLESRLTSETQRAVKEILNLDLRVRFAVAAINGDDEG